MAASFCGADHAHDGGCSFSCLGMKGRSQIHKFTHVSSSVFIHDVTAKQVESKVLNFFEDLAGSDNIFLFLAGLDCYVVANPCAGRGTTVVTRARHFTPIVFLQSCAASERACIPPKNPYCNIGLYMVATHLQELQHKQVTTLTGNQGRESQSE